MLTIWKLTRDRVCRRQVTIVAKKFGPTQGKAAQTWVEEAIKEGSASTDELMQMQLQLFSECKLDDESGRCKDLSDAIEVLTAAVAERKAKPRTDECEPHRFDACNLQDPRCEIAATRSPIRSLGLHMCMCMCVSI